MNEHTMIPENNCPMLAAGLCKLSLEDAPESQQKRIEGLEADVKQAYKQRGDDIVEVSESWSEVAAKCKAELDKARKVLERLSINGGLMEFIGMHDEELQNDIAEQVLEIKKGK